VYLFHSMKLKKQIACLVQHTVPKGLDIAVA